MHDKFSWIEQEPKIFHILLYILLTVKQTTLTQQPKNEVVCTWGFKPSTFCLILKVEKIFFQFPNILSPLHFTSTPSASPLVAIIQFWHNATQRLPYLFQKEGKKIYINLSCRLHGEKISNICCL